MTPAGFNPTRAMDLSGIVAAAKAPPPPPGASYVLDIDQDTFEAVLSLSARHPVVLELNSPRANAQSLSDALVELANEAAGAYLLGRVDVDANPQIAAAFGIQAVPAVIGVVGGQLAPLWQGTKSKEEARAYIGQLLQAAAANGVVGRADPVSIAADAGPDPRFAAADAALAAGDFPLAVAEFDKLLANTPNDPEAKAGRAQAALLARLGSIDPTAVLARAADAPTDVAAQLAAADTELMGGAPDLAFARLVELIRNTTGAERDSVRVRLLELFETVGPSDPSVLKARRALMSALF
ncbi:co-chaperone YbbN [Propionicimonas sp. T2.31MG-18]|uniref:co-chaperone YbbN n=1 Tax=Propionicimonas sp. T2.31MG-18 TaxID=3157620 RepID=UPI003670AD83